MQGNGSKRSLPHLEIGSSHFDIDGRLLDCAGTGSGKIPRALNGSAIRQGEPLQLQVFAGCMELEPIRIERIGELRIYATRSRIERIFEQRALRGLNLFVHEAEIDVEPPQRLMIKRKIAPSIEA